MSQRMAALVKSLIFGSCFVWLWMIGFPRWLDLPGSANMIRNEPLRLIGILPLLLGGIIALACIGVFIFIGRGTPAPFDPPKELITRGPYRYVRNPMYVGFGMVLVGEALLLANFSWQLIVYGTAMFAAVNLFIVFYEEPTLTRNFGDQYREYRAHVRRWIPRLTPWSPHH